MKNQKSLLAVGLFFFFFVWQAAAFNIEDRVQCTANLNVRATPSTSGTLVTTETSGSRGIIIDGPQSANGFTWWKITWDNGYSGWSVQDYLILVTVYNLNIASSNPNSGVYIYVGPNDILHHADGTTSFLRYFDTGTSVTLIAPTTAGGNNFQKWQRNGSDFSFSTTVNFTMSANYTLTAVYAAPPPPTRTLTISSSNPNSGVSVSANQPDNNGNYGGTTTFTRVFNQNAGVSFNAPSTAGGNNFQKWQRDGVDLTTSTTASVTMDANHTITAVYVSPPPVYTLNVESSNPNSGVYVYVGPNDTLGRADGTTAFSRTFNSGTTVTLIAPLTAGGNNFQKWQRNGSDLSFSTTVDFSMSANYTLTAVYVAAPPVTHTLTVASSNPNSGVSITANQPDNNNNFGGNTSFARTFNHNASVSFNAPITAGGNAFQKWQRDGSDLTTSTTASVTMDADHTITAVYGTVLSTPPTIATQPQSQTVQVGVNVSFTVGASGTTPLNYQWRKNGVNIAGANSSTLTLNSVTAVNSGGYSVLVWNAYGSVVSDTASLAVLTDGANGSQPAQISPAPTPTKPPAVDSLVIVTHGFEPFGIFNDVSWVNSMADAIRSHAPANWLVIPYTWEGQAWVTPGFALINARIQGGVYAKALAQQNWQHVHLIGHSAGSAFVEAAAKKFKEISPSTTVHCTYLDPYLSFFQVGTGVYGANADWADCYFAQDATGNFTKGPLDNAYSVDVTWVDPNKQISPIYCSSSTAGTTPQLLDQICGQRATSSHGYPHDFYFASISAANPACASGYGFAMSKEGGGWNNRGSYPVGNQPLVLCGPTPLSQNPFQFSLNDSLQINALPYGTSADGVNIGGSVFTLTTHSPTWLAVGVAVSNTVNFVQFDAGFTSTNAAEGLLTVYWNTNQIGMVDERVSSTNLQSYRFALPGLLTNGLYTLSFRLDPTSNITSSVTVTNVKTGFSGVEQPIQIGMSLDPSNNTPLLMLSGAPNYNYLIESSTNLTDWTATALLVNTNGAVLFADPAVTNFSRRFYRATMP